jgi:TetR/AcrR family transcriptional regulator, transcriptional repressor for nem operon
MKKEDIGLQVVDFFNDMLAKMAAPIVNDHSLTPLNRIEKLLDMYIDVFKSFDYTCGCPIGNLGQEMGDLSPAFGAKLEVSINLMVSFHRGLIDQAKQVKEFNISLGSTETASFIVSS